jgi:hypothetical protein
MRLITDSDKERIESAVLLCDMGNTTGASSALKVVLNNMRQLELAPVTSVEREQRGQLRLEIK